MPGTIPNVGLSFSDSSSATSGISSAFQVTGGGGATSAAGQNNTAGGLMLPSWTKYIVLALAALAAWRMLRK